MVRLFFGAGAMPPRGALWRVLVLQNMGLSITIPCRIRRGIRVLTKAGRVHGVWGIGREPDGGIGQGDIRVLSGHELVLGIID